MIRLLRHPFNDDDGLTLTELVVSLALLGVVLGVAYGVYGAIAAGQTVSDREAQLAREITYPMTRMSEIVMQNSRIDVNPAPTGYTLSVRTDQNMDDVQEQHNFRLVTAGGDTYIEQTSFLLNAQGSRITPARFIHRLGTSITNTAEGIPLFRYYDAGGRKIEDMSLVPGSARSVRITIRATVAGRTITESVTVLFRNRDS